MSCNPKSALAPVLISCLACAPATAAVWIVDMRGSGQFNDLPAAVQAAAPGDVLLVRSGVYRGARIDKSLSVVGEGLPKVEGQTLVENIGTGDRVSFSDIDFWPSSATGSAAPLLVRNCTGLVSLESCRCEDYPIWLMSRGAPYSARILYSTQVVFHDCFIQGSGGQNANAPNGHQAAGITGSVVHFYSCQIKGGQGYTSLHTYPGGRGGDGIHLQNSIVYLSATTVQGGKGAGGQWYCPSTPWPPPGDGGDGIVRSASPSINQRGGSVLGGEAGCILCMAGCMSRGQPGLPTRGSGPWSLHPKPFPSVKLITLLARNQSHPLEVRIGPGGLLAVFFALGTTVATPIPGLEGALWLDPTSMYVAGLAVGFPGRTTQLSFLLDPDPWMLGVLVAFQSIDSSGILGEVAIDFIR